jgi:hypothetical protein
MIPSEETELAGLAGGVLLVAFGALRLIRQGRAERKWKCEPSGAAKAETK